MTRSPTRLVRLHAAPCPLLADVLSWARPHGSATESMFCRMFLDVIPGMTSDAFGNRMIVIGPKPSRVLWSCHVDTVAKAGGAQELAYNASTGVLALANGKPGMSLGADDGAGLWIMLKMIEAQRPGLYVFHRGEEVGCLGSRWIVENTPELLADIDAAVAFDRAGHSDIITHQVNGRTCSDAFAQSFADQLNTLCPAFVFEPDDGGVYTDTNEYAGLVAECSNVSVGYHSNHGPRETLDVLHVSDLLKAMLAFDTGKLVISREAGDYDDFDRWSGYAPSHSYGASDWRDERRAASSDDDMGRMRELVLGHPSLAAALLLGSGVSADDFLDAAWSQDEDLDGPWALS